MLGTVSGDVTGPECLRKHLTEVAEGELFSLVNGVKIPGTESKQTTFLYPLSSDAFLPLP